MPSTASRRLSLTYFLSRSASPSPVLGPSGSGTRSRSSPSRLLNTLKYVVGPTETWISSPLRQHKTKDLADRSTDLTRPIRVKLCEKFFTLHLRWRVIHIGEFRQKAS